MLLLIQRRTAPLRAGCVWSTLIPLPPPSSSLRVVMTPVVVMTPMLGRKYTYGWFKIDAEGNWTYTLDDDDPDTQALNVADTADRPRDVITVVAASDPNITMGIDIILQGKGALTGDVNVEKPILEGQTTVTGQGAIYGYR